MWIRDWLHELSVEVVGLIACTKYGRAEGRFARVYFRSIVHLCAADGNEGVLHAVMYVLYSIYLHKSGLHVKSGTKKLVFKTFHIL